MPRKARNKSKVNHIVVKGLNKEYIFQTEEYMKKYIYFLSIKKDENVKILAYCVMNNHIHLLTYSNDIENISKYMQKVNTSYSFYYNRVKKREGYVFKNRFYSQCIESERQLCNCINYIHNNPVKAGICSSADSYKFSSINEFIENKNNLENIKLLCNLEKNLIIEDNKFIDVKELDIKEYLKKVKKQYGMNIREIKSNKRILENVIYESREKTEVTITELAELLGMSKSAIGRYVKKLENNSKNL